MQSTALTLFNNSIPFSTLNQLLMVLPKDSLLEIVKTIDTNLYLKLSRIFNTKSRELLEYYPDNICLDMINKEYLWQSKIFLKQFNEKIIKIKYCITRIIIFVIFNIIIIVTVLIILIFVIF